MSYAQLAGSVQALNLTNAELVDTVLAVQVAAEQATQTARDAMQAITALGSATVVPAPNQVPRADELGKIHQAWLPDTIVRDFQLDVLKTQVNKIETYGYKTFESYGGVANVDDPNVWELNAKAMMSAFADILVNKNALRFDGSTYYFGNNTPTLIRCPVGIDLVFFGAGMDKTTLQYSDSAGSSRRDFLWGDAKNIGFFDLTISGDWGSNDDYTQRSHLVAINYTHGHVAKRVRIRRSRFMAMVVVGGQSSHVSECAIEETAADGIRPINVKHVTVVNNYGLSVNDDWLAAHWLDTSQAPVDRSVIVMGNTIIDSQGITVLGAKNTTITGNILIRPHTRAIWVGFSEAAIVGNSTEGSTPPLAINIGNNTVLDLFRGSAFSPVTGAGESWISVNNLAPSQGNAPGLVGGPDGSGKVVAPNDYWYLNNVDAAGNTNPGSWYIRISGNTCLQTLLPVSAYSNYGFGTRLGRRGPVDPVITADTFKTVGSQILIKGQMHGLALSGNTLVGGENSIWLSGQVGSKYESWVNCVLGQNLIVDFKQSAIRISGEGMVLLDGNSLDGDPYLKHPNRAANGGWGAGYNSHSAVWIESSRPVAIIRGTTVRNVGSVFRGAAISQASWQNTTLLMDPVAVGYSPNNLGIGNIDNHANFDSRVVIVECDPNSPTFGQTKNICLACSPTMPSTGKYVLGQYVRKANYLLTTINGEPHVVTGWLRLTTGLGHVKGVDWAEVISPISL